MSSKKLFAIALFLLLPSFASAEEVIITVKGMVCSFCAQGIKKTFSALPQVEQVVPDLENKTVNITTKKDLEISDQEITKLINDAGYDVVKIERKGK